MERSAVDRRLGWTKHTIQDANLQCASFDQEPRDKHSPIEKLEEHKICKTHWPEQIYSRIPLDPVSLPGNAGQRSVPETVSRRSRFGPYCRHPLIIVIGGVTMEYLRSRLHVSTSQSSSEHIHLRHAFSLHCPQSRIQRQADPASPLHFKPAN